MSAENKRKSTSQPKRTSTSKKSTAGQKEASARQSQSGRKKSTSTTATSEQQVSQSKRSKSRAKTTDVKSQQKSSPKKAEQKKRETQKQKEKLPPQRMIFAEEANYSLAAVAEGNRLMDFFIEDEQMVDYGTSGNIYLGIVSRVIPSLNAAFVNIGLEKDGFLSMADVVTTAISTSRELKRHRETRIQEILQVGDKVLVQMAKEAIGEKGPALTCKISLPGRFLVYMPYTNAVRMSRMLDDVEKRHFRELVDKKFNLEGGLIFRTAAKNKTQDDIEHDYEYLIGI